MSPKRRDRRASWGRACGLVLIAAASALVTAEIALRLAEPHSAFLRRALHRSGERFPYEKVESVDELLAATPFHPTPFVDWGDFKLNSRGLRTAEYATEKAPNTYRIVVLGDSFAFDSGFMPWDGIWHHRVAKRLESRIGRPVEVINLGVPAVGPRFYLRMFELEGRRLTPDLVLVSVFVGNDLTDEAGARGSLLQRWSYTWRLASLLLRHPRSFLGAATPPSGPGGHPVAAPPYDPSVSLNDEATFTRIEREAGEMFKASAHERMERSLGDTVETLIRLDREVREAGAKLVVVLIPDRIQLEEELRKAVLPSGEAYDFDWVQTELAKRLLEAGIATVDLLPAFRQAPAEPPLYRRMDTHWSAAGNELAAKEIAAALR